MLTAILIIIGCYAVLGGLVWLALRNRDADEVEPVDPPHIDYLPPSNDADELRDEFTAIVERTWGTGVYQRRIVPRPRPPREEP